MSEKIIANIWTSWSPVQHANHHGEHQKIWNPKSMQLSNMVMPKKLMAFAQLSQLQYTSGGRGDGNREVEIEWHYVIRHGVEMKEARRWLMN